MSRGYKRRQKLIRRGLWETSGERSARVFGEFVDNIEKEVARIRAMPAEQLAAIRARYSETAADFPPLIDRYSTDKAHDSSDP